MKIVAPVRSRSTVDIEVSGKDVQTLRAAVAAATPAGHGLQQLRGRGRVDGFLVGTASFYPLAVETLEAQGPDYSSARAQLVELTGPDRLVLSVRVVD